MDQCRTERNIDATSVWHCILAYKLTRPHVIIFSIVLVVMPTIQLDQPIVNCYSNTSATAGLSCSTLPPSFETASQLFDKSIIAPYYNRIAELRHFELKHVWPNCKKAKVKSLIPFPYL